VFLGLRNRPPAPESEVRHYPFSLSLSQMPPEGGGVVCNT